MPRTPLQPFKKIQTSTGFACAPRRLPAALLFLAFVAAQPAFAQSNRTAPSRPAYPPDAVYRIAGAIINSATGEPIRRATVAILSEEDSHTVAAVESDSNGRFALSNLPAAKFQLTASKRGYRTGFYDEHDEFNSAIVTGPGQNTANLTFRLVPGGQIRGVVLTDGGDPVEGARVMLFLKSHESKPGVHVAESDASNTDDTGAYEFNNLAAGEYLLAVIAEPWYAMHRSSARTRQKGADAEGSPDPAAALDVAYPVTYFDSTTDEASAARLTVTGGSRQEADFALHAVPALHIEVDTPRKNDGSIARAELRQTVFGNVVSAESAGFLDAMQSGSTEFTGVAPGHYELAQGDPPRVIELDATANQQVDPSQGALSTSVRGTLQTIAGAPVNEDGNLTLEPAGESTHQSPVETVCIHGAFNFTSVPPGTWQLSGQTEGRQLPIAAISVAGRARRGNIVTVQDRPLSISVIVTQGSTSVSGFARRDGAGMSGVMVVLVPKDITALQALARRDQSDSDGSFTLRDVVPGQYTLIALEDAWQLDWAQPEVLARYLPGGIPVTVSDKPGKTIALTASVPVQTR